MERETTTIEVAGHTLTVKSYASAREAHEIQQVYKNAVKVAVENGQTKVTEIDPFELYPFVVEMVKQLVVELDGSRVDVVARCENLPNEVFQEIVQNLDIVIAKKKQPSMKASAGTA